MTAEEALELEELRGRVKRQAEELDRLRQVAPARFKNPQDKLAFYDRIGRKEPAVMGLAHYLLYIPGLADRTRFVPRAAIDEVGEDEEGDFVLVECPCGARHVCRAPLVKCSGCERHYALIGNRPLVAYGAMPIGGKVEAGGGATRS
jgi:hypothetical protein